MIKVFASFELSEVGYVRSVLESNGIRTFLKNEFSTGALGELPFVENVPELYILDPDDLSEANRILRDLRLDEGSRARRAGDDGVEPNADDE